MHSIIFQSYIWNTNLEHFIYFSHFSVFPSSFSVSLFQYGKTDEMAITLAQSLGQNIGIFSDKRRIINGTLSKHRGFIPIRLQYF